MAVGTGPRSAQMIRAGDLERAGRALAAAVF